MRCPSVLRPQRRFHNSVWTRGDGIHPRGMLRRVAKLLRRGITNLWDLPMQPLKSAMRTNGALELYRADQRQKIVLTRRFWLNFLGSSIRERQHLSPRCVCSRKSAQSCIIFVRPLRCRPDCRRRLCARENGVADTVAGTGLEWLVWALPRRVLSC
jgi:hypothetical protein